MLNAIVTNRVFEIAKRQTNICRLYRLYYNEAITIDELAQKIADELHLNKNSVKTEISTLRRSGIAIPKCTRKPRVTVEQAFPPSHYADLNAIFGK